MSFQGPPPTLQDLLHLRRGQRTWEHSHCQMAWTQITSGPRSCLCIFDKAPSGTVKPFQVWVQCPAGRSGLFWSWSSGLPFAPGAAMLRSQPTTWAVVWERSSFWPTETYRVPEPRTLQQLWLYDHSLPGSAQFGT